MKKFISLLILMIITSLAIITVSYAAETPVYDASYDNNSGAFYANGTDIIISENSSGETVISWNGGSQIVPKTVTVFGGGNGKSSYENSNITMNSGTVSFLVGGGISLESGQTAEVTNAKITVNGGDVLTGVIGGGFLYATVENTDITINDGNVASIGGGGMATVSIGGKTYSVGTEEDSKNSENRTNNVNIVINGGTINSSSLNYGLVYGGGQGYSYTGNVNVKINGGDLTKSYLTASGSNGYTESATVEINGGDIGIYQSVNRGTINTVTLNVKNGNIKNLYIAGETGDAGVTGIANKITANLINGNIETLEVGKSNSQEIEINNKEYTVIKASDISITNDKISSGEIAVTYDLKIEPNNFILRKNQSIKLNSIITTTPEGYEYLYEDSIVWKSSDANIVTVIDDGTVTGQNEGIATITATLVSNQQNVNVTVENVSIIFVIFIIIILAILFLITLLKVLFR